MKNHRAIGFFIGGLALALLAGGYTRLQGSESFRFKLAMDQPASQQTMDLSAQSWPKKLLQPGYFHIRGARTDFRNESEEPLFLHITLSGSPASFMVYWPQTGYEAKPSDFVIAIPPGERLHYRIDVQLPQAEARQSKAGEIVLDIQEQNQQQRFHQQVFTLVNGQKNDT